MSGVQQRFELQIIQTIAGTRLDHGGTSRSVPHLCEALDEQGACVELVTGKPADPLIPCNYPGGNVHISLVKESGFRRHWGMARRFQNQLAERIALANGPVIVHDHGIWLATNRATARTTRVLNVPRIVSPRGMLSQWSLSQGSWKKKIAWRMFQHNNLSTADGFHATGEQEAEDLRSLGFKQPIAIIPNGVVLPPTMPAKVSTGPKQVLFLSRIHPKKGLLNLLRAWQRVNPTNWRLVLAGPNENGHVQEVDSLATELGIREYIDFVGPVNDLEKWQLYCNADLFILPSFSENFGIVIAEALASGLPVITTTSTPWSSLVANDLGWWVEPNESQIENALREATSLPDLQRTEMGQRATRWGQTQFAWLAIAEHMLQFYAWIASQNSNKITQAAAPSFVI